MHSEALMGGAQLPEMAKAMLDNNTAVWTF